MSSVSVWAIDDGYGDLKINNGKNLYLLPSHCTWWRPKSNDFNDSKEVDPLSYISVEVEGERYLVGEGAIEQDIRSSWTGGDNKHLDHMFPILLKACLGILAEGAKTVVVEPLVMGLPVKADENEERHRLLEKIALTNHKVRITFADGRYHECEIYVNEILTKKQPFGSFCDLILDKNGEIDDKAIASQFNVIVDIGARTLNIYTLDNLEPIYDLCDTTNHGIFTAYEIVADFIRERLGYSVPFGKIRSVIRREEIRGYDLRPVIHKSYELLSNEIKRIIDTMLVDSWALVDRIVFTGGGSEVLRPWLEKWYEDKGAMFLDRFATVRGLRKYGVRHARKAGKKVVMRLPGGGAKVVVGDDEDNDIPERSEG